MFAIEVLKVFSAAHALRLPARLGGGMEALHGHDFAVTVRVEAGGLDDLETVMDFHEVEAFLEQIIGPWRNRNLNEIEPFGRVNPSAERIAEEIGQRLVAALAGRPVRVARVRVTEAPGCAAEWISP